MFSGLFLAAALLATNLTDSVVWNGADVTADERSRPFAIGGNYASRTLFVAGPLEFGVEVDAKGDGHWTEGFLKKRREGIYDLKPVKAELIRLVAKKNAKKVTAAFVLEKKRDRILAKAKHGHGGPWDKTLVKAGKPSPVYTVPDTGEKHLTVSASHGAKVTVEIDITGKGTWIPLVTTASADHLDFSRIAIRRIRAIADRDCRATVQLEY